MIKHLPTIQIGEKHFFIDERLNEIREVNNPHNYEPVSKEITDYWLTHNIRKI